MRLRRRRPLTPTAQLVAAADLGDRLGARADDPAITNEVAYLVMRPESAAVQPTLAAVERLLADEAAYDVAMSFMEAVQNLTSHGLAMFLAPDEVVGGLGPRSTVCWGTLSEFWAAVAEWCEQNRPPLKSSEGILSVENEQLRILTWPTSRTLPDGRGKVGLPEALNYEAATGAHLPGFSHIAAALEQA